MSLFSKILNRAAIPGAKAMVPAFPKGAALPLRRAEEEQEAQPLRRAESEQEEPEVQPLRPQQEQAHPMRRMEEEQDQAQSLRRIEEKEQAQDLRRNEEEEEPVQALRRTEEEEEQAQTLRPAQEEGEQAQPLRRVEEEEEQAQPLRRAEEAEEQAQALRRTEEEDAAQPLRRVEEEEAKVEPLRRMEPPEEDMPKEPSPLQALRRDVATPSNGLGVAQGETDAAATPGGEMPGPLTAFDPAFATPEPTAYPESHSQVERPRVHIDQIDVVIHEETPGTSASSEGLSNELARRMRSTYLRGL